MREDNWTKSYRREQGKPSGTGSEKPLAPEISPGVMARGPVADEVNPELTNAEPGTGDADAEIARDERPDASDVKRRA